MRVAYMGVIILAKSCVMLSLVITARLRYITPPWFTSGEVCTPCMDIPLLLNGITYWMRYGGDPVTWTNV